jgi:Serine/threonine protein kinase
MEFPTIAVPERYRIIGVLGSGGMSHVYQAHDSILDKTVAIKVLQIESGYGRDDAVRRFQLEARATASLKHDNIVSILDFGLTEDSVPYMVLDHLEGKSLMEIIKGNGPLQLERAQNVFLQVCAGLEHAHKNGVVHRDLKPSNIIFTKDQNGHEVIKVIDFGIARLEDNGALTATNAVIGSPSYMSPEQANGGKIGITSDVYSLGCVVFETLTGKPPFRGETSLETIMMHVNYAPPKLSDVVDGDFPESLENLVAKLLEKDPDNRFQSMANVITALREIDTGTATGSISGPTDAAAKSELAKTIVFLTIALGLIIGVIAGIILLVDVYMNEAEKPTATDRHVEFTEETFWKNQVSSTMAPDRNDDDLRRLYRNDTRTQRLELAGSDISDRGISYITHLPLTFLDVRFCPKVTDKSLPLIGKISTLQQLRMDNFGHKITPGDSGFKYLADLPKLNHLTVDGMLFSQDDFEAIGTIPNLKSLHINRMPGITKEKLSALIKMPKLSNIEMGSEHHPTDIYSTLAQIKTLEAVNVGSSNITDENLPAIAKMKQLKRLMLHRALITDEGLMYVARNFPKMTELNINGCPKITPNGKKAFRKARPQVNVYSSENSK